MPLTPELERRAMPIDHDVARAVDAYPVGDIRDLVEPVVCEGPDGDGHEPAEADVADSGPGYVVYACPACGRRLLYHHSKGESEPCCTPRR